MNSILYTCLHLSLLNGVLPHAPSHVHARLIMRSTGAWEGDAKGVLEDSTTKTEAWKRRRNRTHEKAEDSDRIIRLSPSDYPAPKRSPEALSRSVQRSVGGADI